MVPGGGFEPPWVTPYAPQTYVSTNSTIRALEKLTKNKKNKGAEGKSYCQHQADVP